MENNRNVKIFALILLVAGFVLLAYYAQTFVSRMGTSDVWKGGLFGINREEESNPKKEESKEVSLYKPAENYERAVIDAVKKASPAVVAITVSRNVPIIESCPGSPFGNVPPGFEDFFGFNFSVPCEKGTRLEEVGGGSGFIVSSEGLIVTNKHVVSDEKASYTVFTNDGKKYEAEVLARDPIQDLAVIKISAKNLPVIQLGDSNELELGQTAIAIGNALAEYRNTVSVGIISGLQRTVTAEGSGQTETIQGVIQTDAAINPGNSGGPLLNLKGEVIGINTAVATRAENIGFAIPINRALKDINSVKSGGDIEYAYLGVRYLMITKDIAERESLGVEYGALVRGGEEGSAVEKDSPADKAGIRGGDIVLEIDGSKLNSENVLGDVIAKYNPGDVVRLKILRGESEIEKSLTLAKRP